MNEALLEAFRHNSWATNHLLAFCRDLDLSEEQLASPGTGTYGSILETFNHIVGAEGGYLRRLTGDAPDWVAQREPTSDFDELRARVDGMQPRWERFIAQPIDVEHVFVVDNGAWEVRQGVIVAQVLHHGNAHREQVCAILTGFGFEPPNIQPWEYAEATGRMWAPAST